MRYLLVVLVGACGFRGPMETMGDALDIDAPSRVFDVSLDVDTAIVDARPPDAMADAQPPDAMVDAAPSCSDTLRNGNETDVDCGGSCGPCDVGQKCGVPADCKVSTCDTGLCRLATDCKELHAAHPALGDGAYAIAPTAASVTTYCDMTVDGGGWTLIGKVDKQQNMIGMWLVSAVNAAALATPAIAVGSFACIDAVGLAVNRSTDLRLSNSAITKWVKWPLPAGRTVATWWHHAAGQAAIAAATESAVTTVAQDGTTMSCFQNIYGINPFAMHGGSYPFAGYNMLGNTLGADLCMSIGTLKMGAPAVDGFTQNGNGFDAPSDEITWPNAAYNVSPHVAVWVR